MATLVFDQEYRIARDTPSDINEHIEVLKNLADSVEHVTEMGTRTGVSTRAFLAADVTLRAYDLFLDDYVSLNCLNSHRKKERMQNISEQMF